MSSVGDGEHSEYPYPQDFIDAAMAFLERGQPDEADEAEQARVLKLMLMRWRGEREVSAWERAVFFALRSPTASGDAGVLSEADLSFLDFLAEQAVTRFRTERGK